MKLLVIEDDPNWVGALRDELLRLVAGMEITVVGSRDTALKNLAENRYDFIVSDLRIPSADGHLDAEVEHGIAVVGRIQAEHAGTPFMILSAFGTNDYAQELAERTQKLDVVGDGRKDNVAIYRTKHQIDKAIAYIVEFAERLRATLDIEIRAAGAGPSLSGDQRRVIQVLARKFDGRVVEVSGLAGGLSDTSTFRMRVTGGNGQLRGLVFVKVGRLEKLEDESDRFHKHVGSVLPPGAFAALNHRVDGGAGPTGALSYTLAGGSSSLLDLVRTNPAAASELVPVLSASLAQWTVGGQRDELAVADVCRALGAPPRESLTAELAGIDAKKVDARRALVQRAVQHCDLHPENVLLDAGGRPVMIDYGEVGDSFTGVDAVALELGLLFHPAATSFRGSWPSVAQAQSWNDLASYLKGCPCEAFVRKCREWAFSASPSDRGIFAFVYAHALRQFTYPDTDKALARALVECAAEQLLK